ncbi:MAG: hypothetical protein AAFN79_13080 [Pseudomonadota bacterium]
MKRILVIGASHAGVLAAAQRDKPPEGVECVFFADYGDGPICAQLDGARLIARDPDRRLRMERGGMSPEVDIAAFDAVVLVGMTVSMFLAVRIVAARHPVEWPGREKRLGRLIRLGPRSSRTRRLARRLFPRRAVGREGVKRPFGSEGLLVDALAAHAEAKLSRALCEMIRAVSDAPILIAPQPYPIETILAERFWKGFRHAAARGDGARLAAAHQTAHHRAFDDVENCAMVFQDASTVSEGFLTKEEFGRDRVNLRGGSHQYTKVDHLHAGRKYGDVLLSNIQKSLK